MSDSKYQTPGNSVKCEYEIKKSRFICRMAPVSSREQVMEIVHQARLEYPDARHHCWAYVLGNPDNAASAAAHDDGEPAGTAGKPILNVLQHKQIGDVVAVVSRYFGGTKLGAGGLVRAYSSATQQASELLTLIEKIPQQNITIECDYADEPALRRWVENHHGTLVESRYDQKVFLVITLPCDNVNALRSLLAKWKGAEMDDLNQGGFPS